jgi:hypothetical protein
VAVTTGREYGLFMDGVLTEPESGDVRELFEPATGEPLDRAQRKLAMKAIREAEWSGETSLTVKVSPHATRGLAL